uniref:Transposon Ty3-I Gag-Pol polyprotein n=1 Tax=Cajanus cajan TaxID=3821 RepID=A0A151SXJ5_CAJCA|nr:Transposon Ty3-I Gag-Pol polyprotein [Cajanus cajan]
MRRLMDQENRIIQSYQEEVEKINLGQEEDRKEISIGMKMVKDIRNQLIDLLKEYIDVFAWSYHDMPGLDREIVEHKLPIKDRIPSVKQKLRRIKLEWSLKIKEEVQKKLEARFSVVSQYPEWLANIVSVLKKNGKVQVCVDYRDLNRASPKDDFPLPHIDVLVDNTSTNTIFSFMDGYSGYNQIKMAIEDHEKTSFITPWGTFCYQVMPIGLRNVGATYQRAMIILFHDMIHKEVKVYVDDMISKSKAENDHLSHLRKLFNRLRKYKLKLNPTKCTFKV